MELKLAKTHANKHLAIDKLAEVYKEQVGLKLEDESHMQRNYFMALSSRKVSRADPERTEESIKFMLENNKENKHYPNHS